MPPKPSQNGGMEGGICRPMPLLAQCRCPQMTLTAAEIKGFKPAAKAYKRADGKGLYIEIVPSGSKLWRWKYRVGGKEKRLALGAWPETSLAKARELRDEARKQLNEGEDPALRRKKAKATAQFEAVNTFAAIGAEYIEKKMVAEGRAKRTIEKARWHLDLLSPAIGKMPISDVDPQMLLAALRKLEARGTYETAKKCRGFASRVFRFAVWTGRAEHDPAAALKGALTTPKAKHYAAMHSEDAIDQERKGADAGLNPMFGDWQQRFDFAPVPYPKGGTARQAFREAIQAELRNKFFYSGEIRLDIVLYLDVQTVLETDETADVDNYSKAISDALKGPEGLFFDDTQIQALSIYWLDCNGREKPHFEISISGSPDDFMLKPCEFHEMADGLWYPHSRLMWTDGQEDEQSDRNHFAGLLTLDMMARVKKEARHLFRQEGLNRLQAYQRSKHIESSARGFHRSRIDDGFCVYTSKEWKGCFERWKHENADEIAPIEELVDVARQNYKKMAGLLAGKFPSDGEEQ